MILGIDPSSSCVGWALLDDKGKYIKSGSFKFNNERITGRIVDAQREILKICGGGFKTITLAYEVPSPNRMKRGGKVMHSRNLYSYNQFAWGFFYLFWAILAVGENKNIHYLYQPEQWKGNKSKEKTFQENRLRYPKFKEKYPDVKNYFTTRGNFKSGIEDESDALGIATACYLKKKSFEVIE